MTTDKPSRNEEEYFAKLEAEKLARQRHVAEVLARSTERQSHHMRCPKCGGKLATEEFHKVQIDRCPDCHGIWLDAGEIDAVVAHEDRGMLGRVFGDMMTSLRSRKK